MLHTVVLLLVLPPTITGEPGLSPDEVGVEFSEAWAQKKKKKQPPLQRPTPIPALRPANHAQGLGVPYGITLAGLHTDIL